MLRKAVLIAGAGILAVLTLHWMTAATQMMRIRILMAVVSMGVFVITLLTIRTYKLREKYAILWLTTALMITCVALFPGLVETARQWFGMQYVTSLVAVIFVFLVLVSFHFSIALSALNDKVAAHAGRIAIQQARIDELAERLLGGRVQRLVQPAELTIGLEIYAGYRYQLLLSAESQSPGALLAQDKLRRGLETPTPFYQLLVKYVRASCLEAIEQPPLC